MTLKVVHLGGGLGGIGCRDRGVGGWLFHGSRGLHGGWSVSHIFLQRAHLVNGEVSCAWAVSIYTIKAFLGAVAKEPPMSPYIGAFGTMIRCGVTGLTADVAADIVSRAAAFVSCM